MNKLKFSGILLMTTGGVLLLGGAITSLSQLWYGMQTGSKTVSTSNIPKQDPLLIVSLPAPQSFVASPLLVRGKVYGPHKKVNFKLRDPDGLIFMETGIRAEDNGTDATAALFQTYLTFESSSLTNGSLTVELLTEDDKIVTSEVIPIQLN